MIDRELAPTTFSVAKFCSSTCALLLKLPLETVLRRGQVAVLREEAYVRALEGPPPQQLGKASGGEKAEMETVVPVGRYEGVVGTMMVIVHEEGSHAAPPAAVESPKGRKGSAAGVRRGKGGNNGSSNVAVAETVYRRGQGLDGLWRGWKVSWWGLVGLWAAGVLGGGGDGEF